MSRDERRSGAQLGATKGEPDLSTATLALVGATASGKTALSLSLGSHLDGEVISMDSRQVYRGMDIGTAKATLAERAALPHHGLDIRDPDEFYSAGQFSRDARDWIAEIRGRGRVPILVGGTGFFLKSLTHPLFEEPDLDRRRVDHLRQYFARWSRTELLAAVAALDPDRHSLVEEGGTQRAIRSIVVPLLTGRPLSWWHRNAPPPGEPVSVSVVWIRLPRELLDQRIATRVDTMFAEGLTEEVESLLRAGYDRQSPGMTGTGYRQVLDYLDGAYSLDEAKDRIRIATRQYARRQETWFRNQLGDDRLDLDGTLSLSEQTGAVLAFCSERCLLHRRS